MVKIDIISGFLGSGKTTLIKKILRYCVAVGEQVVVIENEFGEVGIDGELLQKEGFTVYELAHGCICCTLKTDFATTLWEIVTKIKPDRVIFEPSGIFIPTEIISLLESPDLAARCELNSLLTVVDCVNFQKMANHNFYFFEKQLQAASTLVLSKIQLVAQPEVEQITAALRQYNDRAAIIAEVWDDWDAQAPGKFLDRDLQAIGGALIRDEAAATGHDHHDHEDAHGFDNIGFQTRKAYSRTEVSALLKRLSNPEFGTVLRAKGWLRGADPGQTGAFHEFSYINGQYTIQTFPAQPAGKVCIIGIGLQKQRLLAEFGAGDPEQD